MGIITANGSLYTHYCLTLKSNAALKQVQCDKNINCHRLKFQFVLIGVSFIYFPICNYGKNVISKCINWRKGKVMQMQRFHYIFTIDASAL